MNKSSSDPFAFLRQLEAAELSAKPSAIPPVGPPIVCSATRSVTSSVSRRSEKHLYGPRLGAAIGIHAIWLFAFAVLPDVAAIIGSAGKWEVVEYAGRENVWYIGLDSISRIRSVYAMLWILAATAYVCLWFWSVSRERYRVAAEFSLTQRALQSGVVAWCRGMLIFFAASNLFTWLDAFQLPLLGPGHLDGGAANGESAGDFIVSISVGLFVGVVAAIVRYATITPEKK